MAGGYRMALQPGLDWEAWLRDCHRMGVSEPGLRNARRAAASAKEGPPCMAETLMGRAIRKAMADTPAP
jgi:hypothetical protein